MSVTVSGTQLSYGGLPVTALNQGVSVDTTSGSLTLTGGSVVAGSGCTYVGQFAAAASDTSSSLDTAIGFQTLQQLAGVRDSTAVGALAGQAYVRADSCVFVGRSAGMTGSGSRNVAVGRLAMSAGMSVDCTLIGDSAGQSTTGAGHTVVGAQSGRALAGQSVTAVGSYITTTGVQGPGVYLGSNLTLTANDSNKLVVSPGWRILDASRDATILASNTLAVSQVNGGDGTVQVAAVQAPSYGRLCSSSGRTAIVWQDSDVTVAGNLSTPAMSTGNGFFPVAATFPGARVLHVRRDGLAERQRYASTVLEWTGGGCTVPVPDALLAIRLFRWCLVLQRSTSIDMEWFG